MRRLITSAMVFFALFAWATIVAQPSQSATATPSIVPLSSHAAPLATAAPRAVAVTPAPGGGPQPTPATQLRLPVPAKSPRPTARVGTPVDLRSGPGISYPILTVAQAGKAYQVLGANADSSWLKLAVDGSIVWAERSVLKVQGDLKRVPFVAAPPPPAPVRGLTNPQPAAAEGECHPCYIGVCIPPGPDDLDCGEIPFCQFTVTCDPYRFDGDNDGIGCEACP